MIVSFSVANFRSFSTEQTLSMVASSRLAGSHENHADQIPKSSEKVLKAAVIYGANGAGKSNIFKAFQYLQKISLEPQGKGSGTGRDKFKFADTDDPTSFDLQFVAGGQLYRFALKVDDNNVVEEWLIKITKNKEKILYERLTDDKGVVEINAPGLKEKKLQALVTVGGPHNQSFLSTILANLELSEYGADISNVTGWFRRLILISPGARVRNLAIRLGNNSDLLRFSSDFLRDSSTGVDRLQVQHTELTEEAFRAMVPESVLSGIFDGLEGEEVATAQYRLREGQEISVTKSKAGGGKKVTRVSVQAAHKHQTGAFVPLDLDEESDGTRRLLNLLPALYHLQLGDSVYIIDEIDRSMHPILVQKYVEYFLDSCEKNNRQIIMTTHESNLLDLDLLRRDEIWFVEKDVDLSTHLYSLADFQIRKDLELRKHYLQGRFGGIPFLGNLDNLMRGNKSDGKTMNRDEGVAVE